MRTVVPIFAALIFFLSCGSTTQQVGTRPEFETTVRVKNQNVLDMNVYILYDSQRIRLGFVPSISTRVFVIPDYLVTGVRSLRFLADPVGSRQTPISQEITVSPGEELELTITN
jgi:hypothetical protein